MRDEREGWPEAPAGGGGARGCDILGPLYMDRMGVGDRG